VWDAEDTLIAMTTKYEQAKCIHDLAVKTHDASELRKIPSLLNNWGRKCRSDDELLWTNLSMPMSIGETIIIGLRYKKKIDGTLTEDIFELNNKNPDKLSPHYKGQYQLLCPEYKGTHKLQNVEDRSFTSVNTCCLYFGDNNDSQCRMG